MGETGEGVRADDAAQYHRYRAAGRVHDGIYPIRLVVEEQQKTKRKYNISDGRICYCYDVIPEDTTQTKQNAIGRQEKRRPLGKWVLNHIIEPVVSDAITIHDVLRSVKQ
ncbi:MAG: hypothetical protein MR209_02295 [Veillonellaceae bacterium]|nr:hypothetical protein [Veillonellaceae bacterium]